MGKGQLGPFGSDRPTSCSRTRMDPTVNGNNDECFFQLKGGKRWDTRRFATGLTRILFLFSSLHKGNPLEKGKSTRLEQKILMDLLILEQRSCWWSVSMEVISWSWNVFPISFSSSLLLTRISRRSFFSYEIIISFRIVTKKFLFRNLLILLSYLFQ